MDINFAPELTSEVALDTTDMPSMELYQSTELDEPSSSQRRANPISPASLITHQVKRKKKTPEQIEYLRTLFDQLGGEWDKKVRKEAMQKTGLSRIQVYKWFFDMKLQQKPKEKRVEPAVRVSYPPTVVNAVSTKDLEADNFVPPAIFKIEKVVRK